MAVLAAALTLAACAPRQTTCTNVDTLETRVAIPDPGEAGGLSGYVIRDRNGIESRVDASNSDQWACRVVGGGK